MSDKKWDAAFQAEKKMSDEVRKGPPLPELAELRGYCRAPSSRPLQISGACMRLAAESRVLPVNSFWSVLAEQHSGF